MKHFYILLLSLSIGFSWASTWTAQNSGTSNHLRSIHMLDANTGFIAGTGGTILKTIDGGSNWNFQNSGTSSNLHSIHMLDLHTGWAVGSYGIILKTIDGGSNWIDQTSPVSSSLYSIHMLDANTGFIAGTGGTILKTIDGGSNWNFQNSGTSNYLYSIHMVDANTGWIVGSGGIILKITNGGSSWTPQTSGTSNTLLSIHMVDANTGWIVGSGGTILKTADGGSNWITQTSGTSNYLRSIHMLDANTGFIAGTGGTILKYDDITTGCTDPEACNYDETANADDSSCEYEVDCAGTCGGELEPDCCGICGGDNSQCSNCCGMPFPDDCSEACYEDYCGICDDIPENDCVQDCAGTWGGDAVVDDCGTCGGSYWCIDAECFTYSNGYCDCGISMYDCSVDYFNVETWSSACGGELEIDCAGICGGDNSSYDGCCGLPPNEDCTDNCYIDSLGYCCTEGDVDECDMCFGDNSCICENPFINVDGHCLHQDDVGVLQAFIDNSLASEYNTECDPNDPYCSSPNLYMDQSDSWFWTYIDGEEHQFSNDNGIVDPLELGLQEWTNGRLTSIMCGAYIYCNLSGELPNSISNLTEVEVLRLEVNYFTGFVPESICGFENLNYSDNLSFDLSHNQLCPPYPDCIPASAVQYMDTSECGQIGDVNYDGDINVIDIVITVDLILNNEYDPVGDVNEDGQLNVIDVVILVDWVLSGSGCSDGSSWDYDMDGICDADDADDDNDGAEDSDDSDDNNEYMCSDVDGDTCDDCSSGTFDPLNDGPDMNGNGICDEGDSNNDTDGDGVIDDEDSDPYNQYQCSDNDGDTCDDCSTGHYDTSDDGYDYDGDGQCDAGDCDDDNDGCQECWDYCP